METFESYIGQGIVRKVSPNKERAKKLIKDGKNRLGDVEQLNIEKLPKLVFENIYDAIRDFLLAILLNEGYNTNSHEAPISYLFKKGFDVYTINKLDKFRYKRNGSKYYGEEITISEAREIKEFCSQIKDKLYKLLNNII